MNPSGLSVFSSIIYVIHRSRYYTTSTAATGYLVFAFRFPLFSPMTITERVLNLIFPPSCLSCLTRLKRGVVCAGCISKIQPHQTPFCGQCGSRLPYGKKICHPKFPYILGAVSDYDNATIKSLIHGLKFNYVARAALPLSELLIRYAEPLLIIPNDALVIPVPLGAGRRRKRGFNQAELIAKPLAEHFNLSFLPKTLRRIRNTRPQSELKHLRDRRENVKGCFAVGEPEAIQGKTIILVDDVVTSGSTLYEAAWTLKAAGARKIIALVAAKA